MLSKEFCCLMENALLKVRRGLTATGCAYTLKARKGKRPDCSAEPGGAGACDAARVCAAV